MALDFPSSPSLNQVYTYGSYSWRWDGTSWVGAVPIVNATINNTTIGATTPSTGAFTSLTSTSGAINGTVGATTASTGAFTTLSSTLSSTTTNGTIRNTSAGTGAIGGFYLGNDSSTTAGVIGVNSSTSLLGSGGVGGPLALQVNNLTNNPVSIGVNNALIGNFTSTGLAVTGALSSTTGATFATSSGNLLVGTSSGSYSTISKSSAGNFVLELQNTSATSPSVLNLKYTATSGGAGDFIQCNDNVGLKFIVNANGNVGIGVTPSYKLDVSDTSGSLARFRSTTASDQFYINNGASNPDYSANVVIQSDNAGSAGHDLFRAQVTNSSGTRFVVKSGGNVGIGTTSPSYKLEIRNDSAATSSLDATAIKLYNNLDGGSGIEFSNNVAGKSKISFGVTSTGGGTDDTYFAFSTSVDGSALTERVRITNNGNVGIGTTSPAAKLQVVGSEQGLIINSVGNLYGSGAYLNAFTTAGGNDKGFAGFIASQSLQTNRLYTGVHSPSGVNQAFIGTPDSNPLTFWTAGVERARITSAGLFTVGTGNASAGVINSNFNGSTQDGMDLCDTVDQAGANFFIFRNSAGTNIGGIARVSTTNAIQVNYSSDRRLKHNVRDFTDSGSLIDGLRPVRFDWNGDETNDDLKDAIGFIAQETHASSPVFARIGAVTVGDDDPDTVTKQWQRSDTALIPILVAELKALRQRLAALEKSN